MFALRKGRRSVKKRIVCFGDSNTWGHIAADGGRYDEDTRWPCRLQRMLGDGYAVIEEGQNGRTTVWDDPVENRLAGLTYLWPCMETHHPFELLIVMLGTNDTKTYFSMQPENIARAAGRLVETAQKSPFGPDGRAPEVLLVAPIRIAEENDCPQLFGHQAAEKSKGFTAAFRATAELFGCHFLDAAEFANPDPTDGIHLDAAGHAALAKAMYDKVKEILG